MKKEYLTNSAQQTQKLGRELAEKILKDQAQKPAFAKASAGKVFVLALQGDLGGGKTTFLQGFAKGLGIKEKITSPTFVIMKKFEIPNYQLQTTNYQLFYHLDCYRIQNPKEILVLGFKEIISNPQNIIAIEWAERIKSILPKHTIWLEFEFKGKNTRKIKFAQ